jgi:putative transposase
MKYEFIAAHRDEFPISRMCQVLAVSRSGYYAWCKQLTSAREMANQALLVKIRELFDQHKGRYGSNRIHRALRREGERCSHKRVARLMRQHGLRARRQRSYKRTTQSNHSLPVAANILEQDFTTTAPNQKWCGDISYVATAEGWLYLAVIIDLYARVVVGWAMGPSLNRSLVLAALQMALRRRRPAAALLHHSDRGSQYASCDYQALLDAHQLQVSMSRTGNCYDNAMVESFFATLKVECVADQVFVNRAEARTVLFEYMELYYNRQRLHSSLGYLTPVEYKQAYYGQETPFVS